MPALASHSLRSLALAALAAAALAVALLALAPGNAQAASCPSFKVLHNDRIGPADLPAGNYAITVEDAGLSCSASSQLFARFLEDYDGNLPGGWKVSARGTGKAAFSRGGQAGFSVARTGTSGGGGEEESEGGGTNPFIGRLCPDAYTVNANAMIGPLLITKGRYLIYQPAGSGITCNRAAVLFTRFLSSSRSLPFPWKLKNQTGTFYKSSNPVRSAFRVEPFAGT